MTTPSNSHCNEHIGRVAHAIWEAEGRPEGCDHDHWMRARQLIEEGRAEIEFPGLAGPDVPDDRAPLLDRSLGDAARGMFPYTRNEPELREKPGGRVDKQLGEAHDSGDVRSEPNETPGPRNPSPMPPTNAEGYAVIPSVDDAAAGAVSGDPQPPNAAGEARSGRRAKAEPKPALSDAKPKGNP